MIRRQLVGGLAGVLTIVAAAHLNAAAFVGSMYEGFDYPDATQFPTPGTLNGGQGWNLGGISSHPNAAGAVWAPMGVISGYGGSAAAKTANTPGLTYSATGYLPSSGNKLTLDASLANQSNNMARVLGGQTIDAGSTFFSYLTSKNNDTIRTINFAFFGPGGTTERLAIGQIGAAAGNTGGNIALLFNNANPGGIVQTAGTPIPYGVGVTHLIIGRVDWNAAGNETVTLWVDPTDVTSQAAAGPAYISTSGFELTSFTLIRPFVGHTLAGFDAVSANFDEIRIGGTWESVTSQPVGVPEPASLGLLSMAGLALACLRRQRNLSALRKNDQSRHWSAKPAARGSNRLKM